MHPDKLRTARLLAAVTDAQAVMADRVCALQVVNGELLRDLIYVEDSEVLAQDIHLLIACEPFSLELNHELLRLMYVLLGYERDFNRHAASLRQRLEFVDRADRATVETKIPLVSDILDRAYQTIVQLSPEDVTMMSGRMRFKAAELLLACFLHRYGAPDDWSCADRCAWVRSEGQKFAELLTRTDYESRGDSVPNALETSAYARGLRGEIFNQLESIGRNLPVENLAEFRATLSGLLRFGLLPQVNSHWLH